MHQVVTISIKDDKNRTSRFKVHFHWLTTQEDIQSWFDEFMILAEPIIKGAWVSASLTRNLQISEDRRRVPHSTADVEEKLAATFLSGASSTTITIPTFDDAFTVPVIRTKERTPDFLQDEIQAFFNHFTMPQADLFPSPTDKRGVSIDRLKKSRYKHRR